MEMSRRKVPRKSNEENAWKMEGCGVREDAGGVAGKLKATMVMDNMTNGS